MLCFMHESKPVLCLLDYYKSCTLTKKLVARNFSKVHLGTYFSFTTFTRNVDVVLYHALTHETKPVLSSSLLY